MWARIVRSAADTARWAVLWGLLIHQFMNLIKHVHGIGISSENALAIDQQQSRNRTNVSCRLPTGSDAPC
jgi:hypothetical protein